MFAFFLATSVAMGFLAFVFIAAPLLKNNRGLELAVAAIAVPLFSAGMYLAVGSPQAAGIEPTTDGSKPAVAASRNKTVGSVAGMVDGLAARLKDNPDDGKSWLLLARSYQHLDRMAEAKEAYEHAQSLGEYDEELTAISGLPATAASTAQIFGNVQLSDKSKEIVLPTDTVFIFARAVDGPPMPVAVLQRPASDLPLDFLLNDSQAMSDAAKLSNHEQVTVTARISRSGIATDALKNLEAKSEPVIVAENRRLNLIIE
jgi:tetratricopeptide (TPR) repeat protein